MLLNSGLASTSLARALYVYGDHTVLLADAGVPPLNLIQYTHLAQFLFRLTKAHRGPILGTYSDRGF